MVSDPIRFGAFVLDIGAYSLTCRGEAVRLERIPMELLILLAQAGGRLVTRGEIIARLWGKDTFLDVDNGINTAIRKIRRALGEDPDDPRYIETVVGKGYRLRASAEPASSPTSTRVESAETSRVMFAVLPFENLSGDPSQEYFSDGLTEEIIARLGQLAPRQLGVIARTSSMAYKRTDKTVRQIGGELGVDYVLEGSVRRESKRVRTTAQLIRVTDQVHLWAQSFDSQLTSVLDLHGEIGSAIAKQVRLRLTAEAQRNLARPATSSPMAHDDYLHGLFHMARVTYPDLQKAVEYFRRATERDPAYSPAYTGIADAVTRLPVTGDIPSSQVRDTARAAIASALEINSESADACASEAGFKFWLAWDFEGAKAAARHALELNANHVLARFYLAHILSNTGEHAESLTEIRRTLVLDPLALLANTMYGQFLYHAGCDAESLEQLRATLDLESRFWVAHICMAKTCERLGRYLEALESCEKAWRYSGGNTEALSIAGYVHAKMGDRRKAEQKIDELLLRRKEHYVPPYNIALVFAGLMELDAAVQWLQQAFDDRDVHMNFLRDHKWDILRPRPEFRTLQARVGLPE